MSYFQLFHAARPALVYLIVVAGALLAAVFANPAHASSIETTHLLPGGADSDIGRSAPVTGLAILVATAVPHAPMMVPTRFSAAPRPLARAARERAPFRPTRCTRR